MFHNMFVTGLAPTTNTNEFIPWENYPDITAQRIPNHSTEIETAKTTTKRRKRHRTAFTTHQYQELERVFQQKQYVTTHERCELAQKLKIGEKVLKVWFQNRRMKKKRESWESSDSVTEAEVSSTYTMPLEAPKTLYNKTPRTNQGYVFPDNIPAGIQPVVYNTAFGKETNAYPTQYYSNITNENNNAEYIGTFPNLGENNFSGYDFNDFKEI